MQLLILISYFTALTPGGGEKPSCHLGVSNFTIDVSKLAKGAYQVEVNNLTTKKMLKGKKVVIN